LIELAKENLLGARPQKLSADSGYFAANAINDERLEGIALYVPPNRQKHGQPESTTPVGPATATAQQMRDKLSTPEGRDIYRMRKAIVEPVFGQIQQAMSFRHFSLRGLDNAVAEWDFICTIHNLLKLFRSGVAFA